MMMTVDSNIKKAFGILPIFPIIMVILDPYAFVEGGGIYICDVLILFLAGYLLLKRKGVFYKPLLVLLVVDMILTLLSFGLTSSDNTNIFMAMKVAIIFILYLFVYSTLWTYDIKKLFFKWAEIIGLICAGLAILQFIFCSLGINFYDGRLFLPLGDNSDFGGLFDKNTGDLRVHSFFEEPSYLALFELPITAHLIQEKKHIKAIICGISCIISGSMIGMIGLIIVVLAIVLLDSNFSKNQKARLLELLAIVLIIAVVVYSTSNSFRSLIDYYIARAMKIEASSQRENSSFYLRIIGNSKLFSEYNTINKLIGVGFNQYFLYFNITSSYSNDIVCTLLDFGIIGLIALFISLILIFKNANSHGRIFAVLFIMLITVDHVWFGAMFFYMLTWIIFKTDTVKPSLYLKVKI